MSAKVYGVGVGPGDPQMMTLRAVSLIRQCSVIAVPGRDAAESAAYRIAVQAVPELADKELLAIYMPMTMDADEQREHHRRGADTIERYLDRGTDVAYLTLGDVSIYSTFSYLQRIIEEDGYETELVSGVPSFCAAAARAGVPLVEWNEPMHIVPAAHMPKAQMDQEGSYVLMKSGSRMRAVKDMLRQSGRSVMMIENCGMDGERIYRSVDDIPDEAGYFSLIIAKE